MPSPSLRPAPRFSATPFRGGLPPATPPAQPTGGRSFTPAPTRHAAPKGALPTRRIVRHLESRPRAGRPGARNRWHHAPAHLQDEKGAGLTTAGPGT